MFGLSRKTKCDRVSDRLSEYMDGQLYGKTLQDVEEHLKQCESCTLDLAQLRMTTAILRKMDQVPTPRSFAIDAATVTEKEKHQPYGKRVLRVARPVLAAASFLLAVMLSIAIFMPPGGGGPLYGSNSLGSGGVSWPLLFSWIAGAVVIALICIILFIIWKRNRQKV